MNGNGDGVVNRHRDAFSFFLSFSLSPGLRGRRVRHGGVAWRAVRDRCVWPSLSFSLPSLPTPRLVSSLLFSHGRPLLLRTLLLSPVFVYAPQRTAPRAREQQVWYALNVVQEDRGTARTMDLGRLAARRLADGAPFAQRRCSSIARTFTRVHVHTCG